jgi:sulfite reductase (ferredoxin)
MNAAQYMALDDLSDRYANATLRITTRQSIQFHGVLRENLKPTIAAINQVLLTTMSACGDVVRTVMTSPVPVRDAAHARLVADARMLSSALLPKSRAYHEIFLDEAPADTSGREEEPLYGATYLPRKFKIGLAHPGDNTVDVLTNDLAFIALLEGDRLLGYQVCIGGGLGMTHNKPRTYPRLATPVGFVGPDESLLHGSPAWARPGKLARGASPRAVRDAQHAVQGQRRSPAPHPQAAPEGHQLG